MERGNEIVMVLDRAKASQIPVKGRETEVALFRIYPFHRSIKPAD